MIYHAMNRGVARLELFHKPDDYAAFERVMGEAHEKLPIRILAYCVMPNHWHMVLWPEGDEDLTEFLRWLTHTHTQRYHAHNHTSGTGHLYQARFKAFPVQSDGHFLRVCRYVERNALRANLVERAEDWQWGSLWRRESGSVGDRALLHDWPVHRPSDWVAQVNAAHDEAELNAVRRAVRRGSPYGHPDWQTQIAGELGIDFTLNRRGRPKKQTADEVTA